MAGAIEIYRAHPASDEIAELLEGRLTAALGTINNDGSVHLAYVIFLYEDGRFYLETSSVTRKAQNAKVRGRASMLIQGHTPSGTIVMVLVEGSARVVDGTEAQEVNHRLRAKYIKPEALDAIDRAWNRVDDVAIEITPLKWRSWTGNIFNEETQKELDRSDGELWRYGEIWLSDD